MQFFLSGEGVAIKVSVEKGKSLMGKSYKIPSTEETEKSITRNDALSLVLKTFVFYMTMSPPVITVFLKKDNINCFASPPVFPKPCLM